MNNYLQPDYSDEYPGKNDEEIIEEIDDSEVIQEKLAEEEEIKKEEMPFENNSGNGWGGIQTKQQTSTPTWGGSSGGWGTWGSSSVNSPMPWDLQNGTKTTQPTNAAPPPSDKYLVICDALDVILNTWDSGTSIGKTPAGLWDLKLRGEVLNKLKLEIKPQALAIIYPSFNSLPALGGNREIIGEVVVGFEAQVANYLGIPRGSVKSFEIENIVEPKERSLQRLITRGGIPKRNILYIGVYSGRGGMSSIDKIAAGGAGIDFIDVVDFIGGNYNLLVGGNSN